MVDVFPYSIHEIHGDRDDSDAHCSISLYVGVGYVDTFN